MSSTKEVPEEGGEHRHTAWLLLFGYGVFIIAVSLGLVVKGRPFDSGPYEGVAHRTFDDVAVTDPKDFDLAGALFRELGAVGLVAGTLITAIAMTSFRRGRTWAWYVMWILPLQAALDFAIFAGYRALSATQVLWDLAGFLASTLALVFSYRAFFPSIRKAHAPAVHSS